MIPVTPALAETERQRFADLVRSCSGLEFTGPRQADLERAIGRALAEWHLPSVVALYEQLTTVPAALEAFIAGLTVPETYFFRNQPQFEALEQHILPALIARRRDQRRLRIWSAGCASGEEPYSLAVLLRRLLPDLSSWDVTILATDLNRSLLEKAQRGLYTAWSFRETPPEVQAQYFTARNGLFELAPQVRSQVTFAYLNLADDCYPSPATNTTEMDLILFRNVLIYFGEEMARRVIDRLYEALVPGGWLLVGHAEPSISLFSRFITHSFPNAIVYQKPEQEEPVPALPEVMAQPEMSRVSHRRPEARVSMRSVLTNATNRGASARPASSRPPRSSQATAPSPLPSAPARDDLAARYQAARRLADQSQLELARQAVEALLTQAPLFAPAYYLQGLILQELGDIEAALAALRRCVYVDSGFVMGHFALANLYARSGQAERGRRHREQVVRLLAGVPANAPVPEGEGMTVGELLRAVGAGA